MWSSSVGQHLHPNCWTAAAGLLRDISTSAGFPEQPAPHCSLLWFLPKLGSPCSRQQKCEVQPGHGKPSPTPDSMPGEKCPNPARFAPYWHPCELILPSVYPTPAFPSLGKLSAFLHGSVVTGQLSWCPWGDRDSHHCPELGFRAARAGQHQGLLWLTPWWLPLQT